MKQSLSIPKSILITRPQGDIALKYLEVWSQKIIEAAKKKGAAVLDLRGPRANRKEFEASLSSKRYFIRNIQKLLTSDNKSSENSQFISALYWNFKNQVCLGNGDAKI